MLTRMRRSRSAKRPASARQRQLNLYSKSLYRTRTGQVAPACAALQSTMDMILTADSLDIRARQFSFGHDHLFQVDIIR